MARARTIFVFLVGVPLAASAACARTDRGGFYESPTAEFQVDAALPDAPGCTKRCSSDLKKVLRNCGGADEVVETCGPDAGCGDGKCVAPCLAAELSKGSIGCDFFAIPPEERQYRGSCYAAMIANTWDRPVTIQGEFDKAPLDLASSTYLATNDGAETKYAPLVGPLEPGMVAIIFLAQSDGATICPFPPAMSRPFPTGTSKTQAFHLTADAPVSAYAIYPYGGAPSFLPTATLLLPSSSWTTNYIAAGPERVDTATPYFNVVPEGAPGGGYTYIVGDRTLQIIARDEDTQVQIRPVTDIADGTGVTGVARGYVGSWTLGRGDVIQIVQKESLTGSILESSKPIGVFGGAECSFVPSSYWACDLMQQQIPPLTQWGSQYALVPFRPRFPDVSAFPSVREEVPYTVVAAVDGTVLTYDPAPPTGAPPTLNAGQKATFFAGDVLTVGAQDSAHPVYVGSYMTGCTFGADGTGDPEFVNVVPTDQFMERYVFFVDHTYRNTTLTIVRRKTEKGFAPVNLDCAGEISDFRPIGTTGKYEFAWIRLTADFAPGTAQCGYGRHEAKSDGPFAITVWGLDSAASYGYAGGMALRPLNEVLVPAVR